MPGSVNPLPAITNRTVVMCLILRLPQAIAPGRRHVLRHGPELKEDRLRSLLFSVRGLPFGVHSIEGLDRCCNSLRGRPKLSILLNQ